MENKHLLLEMLLALVVSCLMTKVFTSGNASKATECLDSERNALLRFKQGFVDPSNSLSSWVVQSDCCKWKGVGCSSKTRHVTRLDLRSQSSTENLQGILGNSLLDLPYLNHLDLSINDFHQGQIPQFIGLLQNLEYLNLSSANFRGTVPNELGNLSLLHSLDLSGNNFALRADNLAWLQGLSFLKILDLSQIDLSSAFDWLDNISMLPSLIELQLFACKLNTLPSTLPFFNLTQIQILDLSFNNFESPIPQWFSNMSRSLIVLRMRRSKVKGSIPDIFGNMSLLTSLDLSENSLTGHLPKFFGLIRSEEKYRRSSSLRELLLSYNLLNGSTTGIAQLSDLLVLDLASNDLKGVITEEFLNNFSHLKVLSLSSNSFVFNISPSWTAPFLLDTIDLHSCHLGAKFPRWLRSQKDFLDINIANASISDTVPNWFWNLSSKVINMNLSSNSLRGVVPDLSSKPHLLELDMSYNNFHGPLPYFGPRLITLLLVSNAFSGTISPVCDSLVLNSSLRILDLSSNALSGSIPDCWHNGENLLVISLGRNMLSGTIPNSIQNLVRLRSLMLGNNNLSGELPSSLKYLKGLVLLELSVNRFSGIIPAWIGENLGNLMILRLMNNDLQGNIPLQLCGLKYLRLIDLSRNSFTDPIPKCISYFLTMAMAEAVPSDVYNPYRDYSKLEIETVIKRDPFRTQLARFVGFDLSANRLSGEIPRGLTTLVGLSYLNLSQNHLTGDVPEDIDGLESLEALDLSRNNLSCSIPTSISLLSSLSYLNLSFNNLSGKIPKGNQLDTFDGSSYYGNQYLCGYPLDKDCSNHSYGDFSCNNVRPEDHHEEDTISELFSLVGFAIGFGISFWAFWFTLLLSKTFRYAYFKFLDKMRDTIYVIIALNLIRLRKKLHGETSS